MELSQAISHAIKEFGKDIITEPRFVNILADYDAFSDARVLRAVIREMVEQGFTKKFVNINCQKQYENEVINGLIHDALDLFPYRVDLIQVVVKSFIVSTEKSNTKTKNFTETTTKVYKKPQPNPLTDFQISKDGKTLIKAGAYLQGRVVIPEGIETIDKEAFGKNDRITEVIIPEGVRAINLRAFGNCSKLMNVHLPKSLEVLGSCCFRGCYELKELFLPENVKNIGFEISHTKVNVVLSNKFLKSIDGSVFSKDGKILLYVPHDKTEFDVPDGVETLTYSFSFNKTIKKVKLPKSLKIIGCNAFCNCSALTDVIIPEGVEEIGYFSFASCYSLKELIVPDSIRRISDTIFHCSNLKNIIFKSVNAEVIQWGTRKTNVNTYWGNLKNDVVFYVPQLALEKYKSLPQFRDVVVKPMEELHLTTELGVQAMSTVTLCSYKTKADFCHIENIILGETTWAEAEKLGYRVKINKDKISRNIQGKSGWFWDFEGIGYFNHYYNSWCPGILPQEWENLGIKLDLSYDSFLSLFEKWGFSINILNKPKVVLYNGRKTLNAKFTAESYDHSITFTLNFSFGNKHGEGAQTNSSGSLESINANVK